MSALTLIARIVTDGPTTGPSREPAFRRVRIVRAVSTTLIVLLVGFITFLGFGGPSPAQAGLNPMCVPDAQSRGPAAGGLMWGLLPAPGGPGIDGPWTGSAVTAYEWWRSSGTTWSWWAGPGPSFDTDNDPCAAIGMQVENFVANAVFGLAKMINGLSIGTYQWAVSADLFDTLGEPVDCLIKGCGGSMGLKDALYLPYLAPIVLLGALWMGWQGLVKKRSTEAIQGAIWMMCAAAGALVFMTSPIATLKGLDNVTSGINAYLLGSVASAVGDTETASLCALPEDAPDAATRVSTCTLWLTLEVTPWLDGQFGSDGAGATVPGYEVHVGRGKTLTDLRWVQLDSQVLDHDQMLADDRGAQISADHDQWDAVKGAVVDSERDYMTWAGKDGADRIKVGSIALVASLTVGLLIMVVSFSLLVIALTIIVLTVMAPFFLLLGVHPGFGRPLALKWVEMLLGGFVKSVAMHGFLMALMVLFLGIEASPLPWLGQLMVMLGVAIAGFVLRGPLMNAVNVVRIPGASQTDLSMGGVGKKAAAAAVGGTTGGIRAFSEGGLSAGMRGAVDGGMAATRRPGGLLRAASTGTASGARIAGQAKAATQAGEQAARQAAFDNQAKHYLSLSGEARDQFGRSLELQHIEDPELSAQLRVLKRKARLMDGPAPRPQRPKGAPHPDSDGPATPTDTPPPPAAPAGAPSPAPTPPPRPRPSGGSLPARPATRPESAPAPQSGRAAIPDIDALMARRPRPEAGGPR
jgi:hypothetical protein